MKTLFFGTVKYHICCFSLLTLLVSCGNEPPATDEKAVKSSSQATGTGNDANSDPNSFSSSMLVETIDELWPCTAALVRQLVYVEDQTKFYYCSSNSQWTEIDLKGKDGSAGKDGNDGVAGAPGADGKDGQNGKDGVNGVDGQDGANGEAAPYASDETFIQGNGTKWVLGQFIHNGALTDSASASTFINASQPATLCSSGYRLPTNDEFADALRGGIFEHFREEIAAVTTFKGFVIGVGSIYATSTFNSYTSKVWVESAGLSEKSDNTIAPILCREN